MLRTSLAILLSMGAIQTSGAQAPPIALQAQFKQLCSDMYQGAVIGNRDLSKLVSPAVLSRMASETGGKGYGALVSEIGAAKSLGVSDIVHLSYGDVFVCQFRHETGFSLWDIAYSPMSQTVADFQMAMVKDPPKPEVKPEPKQVTDTETTPTASTSSNDAPKTNEAPPAPTQSEACQMFPDLC